MESIPILLALYAAWGLIVGLMVGFTSIGKGILGTPGLMILFGLEPVIAVGTMGLAGVLMMLASAIQHTREKNVEWRIAGTFSITAIPASYLTARHADAIHDLLPLNYIIGFVILASTILLFHRYVIAKPKPPELTIPKWKLVVSPFLGLVLGGLMGTTSISGSIIVIVFLLILTLPSPLAVGTTSVVACASLAVAAMAHIAEWHVDWTAVLGLVPGVVAGAYLGSKYVSRVPRQLLRYAILIVLAVAGIVVLI